MPEPRNHNHVIYKDVRVPLDHLLGPEDGAKVLAQRRLGGGRIHHAMRTIAQCKLAFDMMCERALSRESHGKIIGEHQMVQEKIAESYASIRMLRLFVLETAWKIDNTSTQEARTDIAAVKFTMAKVLQEVSFNALHILGSLGTTDLTPLQAMYAGAPTMGIADGVDEVHKSTVARRVLKEYRPARGLLADRVLPGQAGGGLGEVPAAVRQGPRARWPSPRATRSTSPAAGSPASVPTASTAPGASGGRFDYGPGLHDERQCTPRGSHERSRLEAGSHHRRRTASVASSSALSIAARRLLACSPLPRRRRPARSRSEAPAPPVLRDAAGLHVTSVTRTDDRLFDVTVTTSALSAPTSVRVLLPVGLRRRAHQALPGALPAERPGRQPARLDARR